MIWQILGRLVVAVLAVGVAILCCLAIASPLILAHWDDHRLLKESAVQFVGIFLVGWAACWIVQWERAR